VQAALCGEKVVPQPPRERGLNALRVHYRCRDGHWLLLSIAPDVFATKDFAEWRSILDATGIIFGIVAKMEDIANDPQMLASEALVPFTDSETMTVNSPIWVKGQDKVKPHRAPNVGEHSDEVLLEAGYSDAEIRAARRRRDRLSFCGREPISFPRPVPPARFGYLKVKRSIRSPIAGPFVGLYGSAPAVGFGRLSRLRLVIGGTSQFASMNFSIETWSV
jgi:hypothetical protein